MNEEIRRCGKLLRNIGQLKAMIFCIEGMTCHLSKYGETEKSYLQSKKEIKKLKDAIKVLEADIKYRKPQQAVTEEQS